MLTKYEAIILKLTQKNNGQLNFMRMDRAAWLNGWKPHEANHVFDQTKILIEKGYIREEMIPPGPYSRYWITDAGERAIKDFNLINSIEKQSATDPEKIRR